MTAPGIIPSASQQRRITQRHLVVCVDDFGMHEGINQAVFDLLALRRISAVSCLVDGPAWATGAEALRQAIGLSDRNVAQGPEKVTADVGLHLNFTEILAPGLPKQVWPLGTLIKACYAHQLKVPDLVREIERQWDRFVAVWGHQPDFIDGHQHVHQLPQIRDALMQVLAKRCPPGAPAKPWIRQCRSPLWQGLREGISLSDTLKAAVIEMLGARVLGRAVSALGLPPSRRLLGVYPFDADANGYMKRWQAWLNLALPTGDVLMCHPASATVRVPSDLIEASRHMEHAVMMGEPFGQMLQAAGICIGRFERGP